MTATNQTSGAMADVEHVVERLSEISEAELASVDAWWRAANYLTIGQIYLRDNNSNFLLEPALTFRGGFERLKLQLQFIRSYNFSNPRFKQDFNSVTLGLNYGF